MAHKTWKQGDHIYVNYGGFTHHGIYCGSGKVIHYGAEGKICEESLDRFTCGRSISIQKYRHSSHSKKVVSRARSRLGEKNYNLIFNNCEHFATWCKIGSSRSKQIENPHQSVPKFGSHEVEKTSKALAKKTESILKKGIKGIF